MITSYLGDLLKQKEISIAASSGNPIERFERIRRLELIRNSINRIRGKSSCPNADIPLVPSNFGYGHEHWLKKCASYQTPIHAAIEHGVYFGDQVGGYGNPVREEWQIGSILTYGSYRKELLEEAYPNNKIYAIGPYISYVETDERLLSERAEHLVGSDRTLTLFPAHSIPHMKRSYDHDVLIAKTIEIAYKADCDDMAVCLSPMDIDTKLAHKYHDAGFRVECCGNDAIRFLARQRAILETSDLTVSNDLGTHVGYSLAFGVPHAIIEPVGLSELDPNLRDLNVAVLRQQKNLFAEAFDLKHLGSITREQYDLVDCYWGLKERKQPSELKSIFESCAIYCQVYANNRSLWVQRKLEFPSGEKK